MNEERQKVSSEDTLVEVVARLVRLQKQFCAASDQTDSREEGTKEMGMKPKSAVKKSTTDLSAIRSAEVNCVN